MGSPRYNTGIPIGLDICQHEMELDRKALLLCASCQRVVLPNGGKRGTWKEEIYFGWRYICIVMVVVVDPRSPWHEILVVVIIAVVIVAIHDLLYY